MEEAKYSIESTLHKCEKVLEKLKHGTPQRTLTVRRIKAFQLSVKLIERELENLESTANGNDLLANLEKLHTTELGVL